ncbi:MAG: DNA polymerase III subunit epsilon, partial [Chitinophagia bacterium]|nr:DNA polymerase III subunit epsilon [Chitinophagia bacterium]
MYAIVDIETTGSRPGTDRIIEIAIVKHNGNEIVDSFSTLINPEVGVPYFISQLTGITTEMLYDAPKFYEVAKKIVEFTADCIFVAHNVRFDYSFVKREFQDLGFNYHRKRLCTVRLSRKLIPGLKSYSLGRLADSLGFSIAKEERHRAYGDAYATAQIFGLILERSKDLLGVQLDWAIEDELKAALIPPNIPAEQVEALPQNPGVYYFIGLNGSPIYIGKAKNIKKRVLEHFRPDHNASKDINFKSQIQAIAFEETGNELTALLLESEEVKLHKPQYNVALKAKEYTFGLFYDFNKEGYIRFFIKRAADTNLLVTPLSAKVNKKAFLENL